MDVASGIAGFVGLGLQVCQSLSEYYNSWKDCNETVAVICDSLTAIEKTLTFLKESLAKRPPNARVTESFNDALQRCTNTLTRLRKKLKKIKDDKSSSGFRRLAEVQWERVKYPLKESTILKLRDILQDQKSDLLLLLNTLQLDSSILASNQWASLSDKMDKLSLDMVNVNTYVADVQKSKEDKRKEEILDWVCKADPSINHENTISKREDGTCNWFLQNSEFRKWKTDASVLWIKGELGRGKSVLCSTVIEHMKQYCVDTPGTLLLYFYFSFADHSKQSTSICLSSLLRQFCTDASVMAMVEQLREKFPNDQRPKSMPFNNVRRCLRSVIEKLKGTTKKVYVIFDALDELPNDPNGLQRAQMLNWIAEVSSQQPNIHILFTSRVSSSCIDIETAMSSQSRLLHLSLDAAKNIDDIHLYLERQFQRNSNLSKLKEIAQMDIIEKLLEKSGGMFQWVSCQLNELKDLQIARPKDIESILSSMPPNLDECYMRILQGVNSRFQSEVEKALQWLSLSFQPLSLIEVNEACIINLNGLPAIKEEDKFIGDGIITYLSSFVTRTGDDETSQLSLSHFSVKGFLMSSMIKDSAYSTYGFQESDAHAFIAESCIAYIFYYSSCPMRSNTTSDLEYFPLLFYACRYWFEHVRLAGEEQERLVSLVIKLLTSWEVYLSALRIYNPLYPEKPFPCKIHTLASTLGWAAALGLEFLVKQLLQENISEINAIQDIRYFTPEHVYSSRPSDEPSTEYCCEREGRDKMRMTLFANPIRGTALMKAVAHNHENVVRLLIKNGADLHITLYGYAMDINSALSIACDKGHENMVTILLENGANPNKICGRFSTLTSVLHREGFNICRILLDNGAHSDESDSTQESLLMRAASNRQPDICKLLLDHQADINWRMDGEPEEACDALSIASRCGNVELVELFLSRMAHIRPEALLWSLCCSPDFCEDASKNKKVCELLIRHGADLNPDPEDRDTPLAMALHNEWYDIAELMLSKGALVDPNDPSYLTAGNILVAATGSLDMTRRILDMGVDANAQVAPVELFGDESIGDQQYFSSALQAAAFHYNDEVVGLLLKRNADPRIKGPPYGSALFAVVGRIMWDHCASYDELVKAQRTCEMLLAKGASWDRTYGPDNQELMNDCEAGRLALAAWQDAAVPKNIKSVFLKGTSLFLNFD